LCKFFWRVFVANAVVATVVSFAAVTIIIVAWKEPLKFFSLLGGIVAFVASLSGVVALKQRSIRRKYARLAEGPVPDSLFIQGLKSVKSKVCPIIRFK
jgi:hypothetical protein